MKPSFVHTELVMPRSHRHPSSSSRALSLAVAVIVTGCVNQVGGAAETLPTLPVAELACPVEAVVGVPFTVDGAASYDGDGPLATAELTVAGASPAEGDAAADGLGLTGTFVAATEGVITARLVVDDEAGNSAEARCRFAAVGGGEPDPVQEPEPTEPEPGTEPDPVELDPQASDEPIDLTGTFALVGYARQQLAGFALDPSTQCADAPEVALVEVEQNNGRVELTGRVCHVTFPSVNIALVGLQETTAPRAFLEALPDLELMSLSVGEVRAGSPFVVPPTSLERSIVAGATLDDTDEPLPTDPDDPQVSDDDGDGEPGVSILSSSGEQPIVFRWALRALQGTVVSRDEIDGATLGSYRSQGEATLLSLLSFLVPVGEHLPSTFKMLRIDGTGGARDYVGPDGVLTCDDVRAHLDELLEAVPPPPTPDGCMEI